MGSRRHPSCVDKLGCSIPVSFLLLHYVWLRLGKWIHVHSALKFSQRELFREIDWRPYFWHHQDTNMEIQWGWKYLVIGKVMAVHPTRNMFETKNMCPKTHHHFVWSLFMGILGCPFGSSKAAPDLHMQSPFLQFRAITEDSSAVASVHFSISNSSCSQTSKLSPE